MKAGSITYILVLVIMVAVTLGFVAPRHFGPVPWPDVSGLQRTYSGVLPERLSLGDGDPGVLALRVDVDRATGNDKGPRGRLRAFRLADLLLL